MAPKNRDRRFPVSLPIVKDVRLTLWAYTRNKSKTAMAEAILIDRVSNASNWGEVCTDLRQEAAIRQMPVEDLVKDILRSDYEGAIAVDEVDWSILLEGGDPDIDEVGVDNANAE